MPYEKVSLITDKNGVTKQVFDPEAARGVETYSKTEVDSLIEKTPDFEEDESSAGQLADDYALLRQDIYQAVTDAQAATEEAENVNVSLNGTTLTVTNRNGQSTSVNTKGEPGTTDYNELANRPALEPVATSGNYEDLKNKPDLSDVDFVEDNTSGNPFS